MTQIFETEYSVSAAGTQRYQRDGFILLREVASSEAVDTCYNGFKSLIEQHNTNTSPLGDRSTYDQAFIQIGNLWQKDVLARHFVFARRFAKIAADLMGVSGVRLYHDQALWKEPGGGHTPWHQDQVYWPLDTDKTITMWMPLVDTTAEMGTMSFAPGSHRLRDVGQIPISDYSQEHFQNLIRERDLNIVNVGDMKAGDATFHSGWTLHGAPRNETDKMRAVMTIIYYAEGSRVGNQDNDFRKNDLKAFFPGLQTGDIAATELNPLLYSRTGNEPQI